MSFSRYPAYIPSGLAWLGEPQPASKQAEHELNVLTP